jgi:hypothetical protein
MKRFDLPPVALRDGVRVYGPGMHVGPGDLIYECRYCGEPHSQRHDGGIYFVLRGLWCCLACGRKNGVIE